MWHFIKIKDEIANRPQHEMADKELSLSLCIFTVSSQFSLSDVEEGRSSKDQR